MSGINDELLYVMLWYGENAQDWEVDFWQHIKQTGGFVESWMAEDLIEAFSHEEWQEKRDQLIRGGWQYTSSGSGILSRMSVFTRKP